MDVIEIISSYDPDSWLETLKQYQYNTIKQLYSQNEDYQTVAKIWLSSYIPNTEPFGGEKKHSVFYEKILDEVEAFLNGDKKYNEIRQNFVKESGTVQNYIVFALSTFISSIMGTATVFLAPVIALVFVAITKIGINAWLASRREKREKDLKDKE